MFNNNPIPFKVSHKNPLVRSECNPDPYMILHDGIYYCYSTGHHGVNVLRSKNLESFEHMGFALHDEEWESYWAPAVIHYNGTFYMYYSSVQKEESDVHKHYLQVAVSDNPLGPFIYKKTLFDEFTIDPHVIEKDGQLYLFYSANITEGQKIGTIILLDKLLDPFTPQGKPRLVVAPSIEQEIFAKNRLGDGRDWYTIEGGFYFESGGTGFLMYSANAFMHGDYFVGYSTCDLSVPLDEAVFQKQPDDFTYNPLIGKDEFFTGCGHNSVIKGLNDELLIVYHGRPRAKENESFEKNDGRRLCISGMITDNGKLTLVKRNAI